MASLRRLHAWEKAFFLARQQRLRRLSFEIPPETFRRGLDICGPIEVYAVLPRAMELLRQRVGRTSFPNGMTILARTLTQAKGRFSRPWWAPKGGLWLAIAVYDDFLPEARGWLPLVFGLAVTKALQNLGALVSLRWISDVHHRGDKVAGLLVEEVPFFGESWFLVGLGVNVNNVLPSGLQAQNLRFLLGSRVSLTRVFGEIAGELVRFFGLLRSYEVHLLEGEEENPLRDWFYLLSDTPGQKVIFGEDLSRGAEGLGLALELDPLGGLRLETEKGPLVLRSGEIRYL